MSMENLKAFYERVEVDKVLQAKLIALGRVKTDVVTDPAIVEFVKIAAEMGFEFTTEEYLEARKPASPQVKKFFEMVVKEKALQSELKALDKKANEALESVKSELVEIAKAAGFKFTLQDLEKARREEVKELSAHGKRLPAGCIGGGLIIIDIPVPPPPQGCEDTVLDLTCSYAP
jgi:predicted ribosomally synthesized peptide with nif11-like leader